MTYELFGCPFCAAPPRVRKIIIDGTMVMAISCDNQECKMIVETAGEETQVIELWMDRKGISETIHCVEAE